MNDWSLIGLTGSYWPGELMTVNHLVTAMVSHRCALAGCARFHAVQRAMRPDARVADRSAGMSSRTFGQRRLS